jgi:hypothetical protein
VGRSATRFLAAGLVVFLAGIARDLQWHATHDTQREFETAGKQVEVHWLLWLGVAMLIAGAWLALSRSPRSTRIPGAKVVLAAGLIYAAVSVWHYIAHANGEDPELAHIVLYLTSGVLVAGTLLALLTARRGRVDSAADSVEVGTA